MTTALDAFTETEFTDDGTTRTVYRAGTGPGVIVINEIPGITPKVAAFGNRLVDAGFTVAMPSLFGEPGRAIVAGYVLKSLTQGCVSREFTDVGAQPHVADHRLAARARARPHEECGGPGVGAVGMCFTGGFALAMAVDDTMLAPVLSQPSLPFAVAKKPQARARPLRRRSRHGEGARGRPVRARRCGSPATGSCPAERFAHLREELGDSSSRSRSTSKGNPHGIPKAAHSVLTEHLVDEPGHPTRDALDQVLAFFRERLRA